MDFYLSGGQRRRQEGRQGGARALGFHVREVADVIPLPKQVRERWTSRDGGGAVPREREVSEDEIRAKLDRAFQKRQDFLCWVVKKASGCASKREGKEQMAASAKRLQEKLATAEQKRRSKLEAVRLKAAAMLGRTEEAAVRVGERQSLLQQKMFEALRAAESRRLALIEAAKERLSAAHELALSRMAQLQQKEEEERNAYREQLGAKMVQADAVREARLAAVAEKARNKVQHAKHISKMRRLNDQSRSETRRHYLNCKLQEAADRRKECYSVKTGAIPKNYEGFLKRQSTRHEYLRRQGSIRKVQRCWLAFKDSQETTHDLVAKFAATGISSIQLEEEELDSDSPHSSTGGSAFMTMVAGHMVGARRKDAFEDLASRMESEETLIAAKNLLQRLRLRLLVKSGKSIRSCASLLRRLYPKMPNATKNRYPTRVFLCAYMIVNQPDEVFNTRGDREAALRSAAGSMIEAFERIMQRALLPTNGAVPAPGSEDLADGKDVNASGESSPTNETALPTIGHLVSEFDDLWLNYLELFVAWKCRDAACLEVELMRMAMELEASCLRKCRGDRQSPRVLASPDLQAVVEQTARDLELIRERVQRLSGADGVRRLKAAVCEIGNQVMQEIQEGMLSSNDDGDDAAPKASSPKASKKRSASQSQGESSHSRTRMSMDESEGDEESSGEDQEKGRSACRPSNLGNEAFVWELLHDRNWQLPTGDVEAAWMEACGEEVGSGTRPLRDQVRVIAEQAFWDSMEWRLRTQQQDAAEQLSETLSGMGQELSETLPEGSAAQTVLDIFKKDRMLAVLSSAADSSDSPLGMVDAEGLLQLLEHTAELMQEFGAPARDENAACAHRSVHKQINDAMAKEGEAKVDALAKAISRALRLLMSQLRVLKLDASNARLRMLGRSMTGATAVDYVRGKFASIFGMPSSPMLADVKARLPKAAAWATASASSAATLPALLEPITGSPGQATAGSQIPVQIRSGLRQRSPPAGLASDMPKWAEVGLVAPVGAGSWRAAVRAGLVDLVAREDASARESVPETLQLDAERLHGVQNRYQRVLVMAAASLVVHQYRGSSGFPASAPDASGIKERLSVVLSDPEVTLSSVAVELCRLVGTSSADMEAKVKGTLTSLLARDGPGFKALEGGVKKALASLLVLGPQAPSAESVQLVKPLLARVGGAWLVDDVVGLAEAVGGLAGVSEAVHEGTYKVLFQAEP